MRCSGIVVCMTDQPPRPTHALPNTIVLDAPPPADAGATLRFATPPGGMSFLVGGVERVRLDADGAVYVDGKKAGDDPAIVGAMRAWLDFATQDHRQVLADERARTLKEAAVACRGWARAHLQVGTEQSEQRAKLLFEAASSLLEMANATRPE